CSGAPGAAPCPAARPWTAGAGTAKGPDPPDRWAGQKQQPRARRRRDSGGPPFGSGRKGGAGPGPPAPPVGPGRVAGPGSGGGSGPAEPGPLWGLRDRSRPLEPPGRLRPFSAPPPAVTPPGSSREPLPPAVIGVGPGYGPGDRIRLRIGGYGMSGYRSARTFDASRLWSGGIATAIVAALLVLVATLAVRGVLGVPALAHGPAGEFGDLGTALHAALAGAAALAATALLHLLLAAAARPTALFCWIAGA